jgi:ketosteroid isomerase-like protein
MDTKQVGQKLVDLCKAGKNMEAIDKLYSPNIVSVEAHGDEKMPREMKGIDAIRGKNQWWNENHEVHKAEVRGPFPNEDKFATQFHYEVTPKTGPMKGKRFAMDEIGVYTVKDGKIVREEFFYDQG